MSMQRKLSCATLLLVVPLSAANAQAVDSNSWVRDTERLDYYTAPPEGGDASFFTAVQSKGVVSMLYEIKGTLNQFPLGLYEMRAGMGDSTPAGCQNNYLNTIQYFMPTPDGAASLQGLYDATKSYPDPEPAYTSTVTQSDGFSAAANDLAGVTSTYYQFGAWNAGPAAAATIAPTTAKLACQGAGATGGNLNNCQSCVTSKGYWLNPGVTDADTSPNAGVFAGNFLRFYPPKWVLLKLAYKRLLNSSLLSTIREGVIISNGTLGGSLKQPLLPSSCSGQGASHGVGILKQKVGALDGLTYTGSADPLAEMLFNAAYYMSGDSSSWCCSAGAYFTSNKTIGLTGDDGKGGPCPGCQQNFLILFSDGRVDSANPYCATATTGPCQAAAQCSTLGMGAANDGNDFLDPSFVGGAGTLITGPGVRVTASGTCDMDFADDVAGWMANNNMVQGTPSNIITYVVGIGSNTYGAMNSLQAVATNGNGKFVQAQNFSQLESQVRQVLLEIIKRSTSFSVAAITTVQTRGSTFAFIPRFRPLQGNDWEGKLFRFKLWNEFSAGCTVSDTTPAPGIGKDPLNPNGDSNCTDIYLVDADSTSASSTPTSFGYGAPAGSGPPNFWSSFIGEDCNGNFIKLNTQANSFPFPPTGTAPCYSDGTPAKPVWEASARLTQRVNTLIAGGAGATARNIFTVYDATNSGTYNSTVQVDTTPADLAIVTPLLQLGGVSGTFCTELAALSKHTYSTQNDCAADVVNFLRGQDVLWQNPKNKPPTQTYARPNVLGDIFHSSPILVTPPVPWSLCMTGVPTQCNKSISLLPGPRPSQAYDQYVVNQQYRQQLLLVGANDGMLHAFDAGTDKVGDDPETPVVEQGSHYFSLGTGDEVWAFIPPDLLPKLSLYVLGIRHELYVDGTPEVRDIWVDGSGSTLADHVKQADEFHTVAVVGEREGGRRFFALDVTTPASPKFLWEFPGPGTPDDLAMGETWNDFAPSHPPIGAVPMADAAGPLTINGTKASERWIVALNGGFDPNYIRGRAAYILDVWTGQELWNFRAWDATGTADPRYYLGPVASTPSLINTTNYAIWDTMFFGDTWGQVYTVSLLAPGTIGSGGLVSNWFGARAFVEFAGQPLYNRAPFFALTQAATVQNTGGGSNGSGIMLFVGSGDRFQVKDSPATSCGLDNLAGCLRRNCSVSVSYNVSGSAPAPNTLSGAQQVGTHYVRGSYSTSGTATTVPAGTAVSVDSGAASAAATDNAFADVQYQLNCGSGVSLTNQAWCDWGASQPGTECPLNSGKPLDTQGMTQLISCASPLANSSCVTYPVGSITPQVPRFYALPLFDATRKQFTDLAGAATYDQNALTDSNLVNANTTTAGPMQGWYVPYQSAYEKTTASAFLLAGCVVWSTLTPNTVLPSCGTTVPPDTANLYQANAANGNIQCGLAGSVTQSSTATRYTSTQTIVPPPALTTVVSYNAATQQVGYSGVSLSPSPAAGSESFQQANVGSGAISGDIEWIEVTPQMHNCRHNGTCN